MSELEYAAENEDLGPLVTGKDKDGKPHFPTLSSLDTRKYRVIEIDDFRAEALEAKLNAEYLDGYKFVAAFGSIVLLEKY